MPRAIDATVRADLESPQSPNAELFFLALTHPQMSGPLYVVDDNATMNGASVTYVYGGNSYLAVPFKVRILTDDDRAPTGHLTIPNFDYRVAETILALKNPINLTITILPSSDFDLTLPARTVLGAGSHVIYKATGLTLRNIKGVAAAVEADIVSIDDTREPWPSTIATKARFPGLYR